MEQAVFALDILAAEGPFFRGECISAAVPTTDGSYGVLAHHANAVGAIVPGELTFRTPDGILHRAAVSSGLIKVEDNHVLLLVDSAEHPEDIDANRARRAKERAEEELLQKKSMAEYRMAEASLARAMNRLKISYAAGHNLKDE